MVAREDSLNTAVDPDRFRETLGHFPTGVVVVTAIDDAGQPQGMVIGSFTSVSLDPPLVAYLPAKTSRTYQRLRTGKTFCVNVLSAEQEALCRHFFTSEQDKFADIPWRPAPSGAPILEGAVSWIDCEPYAVQDGGDHHIVLGRVTNLAVQTPVNPLLFFQGGYGRFSHRSLVSAGGEFDLVSAVRQAETGREYIQALADELHTEVSIMGRRGAEFIFVSSAVHAGIPGRTVLGTRVPLMAPLGDLHMSGCSDEELQQWARASLGKDEEAIARQIARVRQGEKRGWSVSLVGDRPEGELRDALRRYSNTELTPTQQREITSNIAKATPYYPSFEVVEGQTYDLHSLMFTIPTPGDRVDLVLRVCPLPLQADAATVQGWIDAGLRTAARLGTLHADSAGEDSAIETGATQTTTG